MQRLIALTVTAIAIVVPPSATIAQSATDQRWHITNILTTPDKAEVMRLRSQCAAGLMPAMIAGGRNNFGTNTLPEAAPWCIAALTRTGRDGTLAYVRNPSDPTLTPALAFDNGFVSGYRKQATVPADSPSMAALQPVAQRCFGQHEPDTDLCNAAGYAIGARAARGELPVVP